MENLDGSLPARLAWFEFAFARASLGLSATAAMAQDVIKFGAPLPLTGPLAPEAIKQQQGYDLWAEQANKAGGISVGGKKYKVEIVYADYQSNTPRAVQTTEQMITQNNVIPVRPFGSGAAKAGGSVSEKYKVPTIAATASSSQVYDQGYKYLFGTFTPNDTLTTPLTQMVKAKAPDVKKVAILARNDLSRSPSRRKWRSRRRATVWRLPISRSTRSERSIILRHSHRSSRWRRSGYS
jgi:branched-chain amino acid transport system substrate-binding protein